MRQRTNNRIGALAALLLSAAAFLAPSAAFAQSSDVPQAPKVRALDAMRAGQECYRRGDYDGAAALYQNAEANKKQLSPAEQANLTALIQANTTALEASRTGAV